MMIIRELYITSAVGLTFACLHSAPYLVRGPITLALIRWIYKKLYCKVTHSHGLKNVIYANLEIPVC